MALKKFLSLDRLSEYDGLIKSYITNALKAKANATHSHDDLYYTESEIDTKISGVNSTISGHTGDSGIHVNSTEKSQWNSAYTHSTSAHAPTNAEKNIIVGIQKNGTDVTVNSSTRKVNITVPTKASDIGAATSDHNHDDKYDAKGAAADALSSANSYTDGKVANLLNNSSEAVDSIMELAAAMEDNADAIGALETVAGSKVPNTRKVNGKALSSDITLTASDVGADASGSAAGVQTNLNNHINDTTKHITSTERTNWGAAYTHSQAAHAPSNAQANVIESVKVNGTALSISSKSVNITVPTKASDIGASATGHKHETSDINGLDTALTQTATSISGHTTRIGNLETKVGDGFAEITSAEIQALFE